VNLSQSQSGRWHARRFSHLLRSLCLPVLALAVVGAFSVGATSRSAQAGSIVQFALNYSSGGVNTFNVELYDTAAPITVANYLRYVTDGLYDGTIFHRSMPGFVVQGGGFAPQFSGSEVTALNPITNYGQIQNEFSSSRSNLVGTIAMAKVPDNPNSATNQWFVNLADNSSQLDGQNGGFTVFGKVIGQGMTLINSIASLTTSNLSSKYGGTFTDVPMFNSSSSFVTVTSAKLLSFTGPQTAGAASLSGKVYVDFNHNGVMDGTDYVLSGAQVTLTESGNGSPLATVITGADGSYRFNNMGSGTYTVAMATATTVAGLDNGTTQKIIGTDGTTVISTGSAGTSAINAFKNITLTAGQSGVNFNMAESAYPVELMSVRMLLNSSTQLPTVSATAMSGDLSTQTTTTPAPEPGAAALLAVLGGFLLTGWSRRRRARENG
jgi:peptidyl-prolyl cis-trans isomerase A (cyclophilin A)